MRAKFHITEIKKYGEQIESADYSGKVIKTFKESGGHEILVMAPVCPNKFGPNGEHEDNVFARYTPSGSLQMTINNPDLLGKFKPGEKYYLDFTKAE